MLAGLGIIVRCICKKYLVNRNQYPVISACVQTERYSVISNQRIVHTNHGLPSTIKLILRVTETLTQRSQSATQSSQCLANMYLYNQFAFNPLHTLRGTLRPTTELLLRTYRKLNAKCAKYHAEFAKFCKYSFIVKLRFKPYSAASTPNFAAFALR